MSKFVRFSVTEGGVVGKARKRLRGDNNRKPEIKKCDLDGGGTFPFWTCVCNYEHNVPSSQQLSTLVYNHSPKAITYPSNGTGSTGYIGQSIFLKYFRFKGYLFTEPNSPVQVRWRLVLMRIDWSGLDVATFSSASHYLGLYKTNSIMPISSMNSLDTTVEGAARNFYSKQKDVEEWGGIKRVVIATGVLPPGNNYIRYSDGNHTTVYEPEIAMTADLAGYRGYSPIDVKVTLNDRVNAIKKNVRYYLIFESDCGLGYPTHADTQGTGFSQVTPRVDWPTKSPVQIRIQGTTYYTDA